MTASITSRNIAIAITTLVFFSLNDLTVNCQDELCSTSPTNFADMYRHSCSRLNLPSDTCQSGWTRFAAAFAGIDPLTVTPESYREYFTVLPTTPEPNESLFWSRTRELVEMISCMCDTAQVLSSANAHSTAIINNIMVGVESWCGTTDPSSSDGIEYVNQCPCEVSRAFFEEFSATFAKVAQGTVFYLGYGEREGGTFSMDSFFARYEVPNLRRSEVTNAVVMVVHRNGIGESCGEGTLVTLRQLLEAKGFEYSCYDVFGDPKNSLDIPALRDCAVDIITAAQQGMEPGSNPCSGASGLSLAISLSGVVISTLLAIVMRL